MGREGGRGGGGGGVGLTDEGVEGLTGEEEPEDECRNQTRLRYSSIAQLKHLQQVTLLMKFTKLKLSNKTANKMTRNSALYISWNNKYASKAFK